MAYYIEPASRPLHLQIRCDNQGSWSVHGLGFQAKRNLPSLAASIEYARRQCGAAPATIELLIDGFYAVAHQKEGWPRQLVGPPTEAPLLTEEGLDSGSRRPLTRLRQWLGTV